MTIELPSAHSAAWWPNLGWPTNGFHDHCTEEYDVRAHLQSYDTRFSLGLTEQEMRDVVEYLKSL